MDGGAWWATVHAVAKSQARLSDITNEIRTFTPVTNGNPVMGFPPLKSCVHACVHMCVLAQVCVRRVYVFVTHVCK